MPAYLYGRHIHAVKKDFDELVLLKDRTARQNVTFLPFTAMKKALTFFTELRQSNQNVLQFPSICEAANIPVSKKRWPKIREQICFDLRNSLQKAIDRNDRVTETFK